jgi:hypothetical protein
MLVSFRASFFVSMDVTFHENEPYYGISSESGIYLSPPEEQQERGSIYGEGPTVVPVLAPTSGESQISNNTLSQGEDYNAGDNDDFFHEGDDDYNAGDNDDFFHEGDDDATRDSLGVESTMHEDPSTDNNFHDSVAPINSTRQSDNQPSISSDNFPIVEQKSTRAQNPHPPDILRTLLGINMI